MRKSEIMDRNISLVFDFLRYIIEHPEIIEELPDGCELEFIDKGFPSVEGETEQVEGNKIMLKVGYVFDISS